MQSVKTSIFSGNPLVAQSITIIHAHNNRCSGQKTVFFYAKHIFSAYYLEVFLQGYSIVTIFANEKQSDIRLFGLLNCSGPGSLR